MFPLITEEKTAEIKPDSISQHNQDLLGTILISQFSGSTLFITAFIILISAEE